MWIDEKYNLVEKEIKSLNESQLEIIDLGARDQILKKFLPTNCNYTGVDKFKNGNNNLIINLDENFNQITKKYDIVCALDIIEHVDDPIKLISNCKKICKKIIYLNIPNAAYYSFRLKFLFFGDLTNQFHFSGDSNDDRHRWFTNYTNTLNFLKKISDDDYNITLNKVYKTRNKLKLLNLLERFLGKLMPGIFCWSFLITLKKND